jgi:aminoglycoside 2'-N-acetyltransferase I
MATSDDLGPGFLRDLRILLDSAFEGDFTDDDWCHALGGVHVWVSDPDGVISHGSLVERTLVCDGYMLRVGFVEAVATATAHRRNGHGTAVMKRIGELIRSRYALGVLSTWTHAFYEAVGWERWSGATFVDGPRGVQRTPGDDGDIMILRTWRSPRLDPDGDIIADWRPGDVW